MRLSSWFVFGGLAAGALAACGGTTVPGGSGGQGGGGAGGPTSGGGHQGGAGSGAVCGGIAGMPCPANEFCDYPDDDCGAADGTGVCTLRPQACDKNYAPTCGCDGVVHSNVCDGNAAGTDVNLGGGCTPPVGMFACGEKFCADGYVCTKYGNDVPGPEAFYGCATAPAACTGVAVTCACANGLATVCGGTCMDVPGGVLITCPGG